jgi:hypothetical protein
MKSEALCKLACAKHHQGTVDFFEITKEMIRMKCPICGSAKPFQIKQNDPETQAVRMVSGCCALRAKRLSVPAKPKRDLRGLLAKLSARHIAYGVIENAVGCPRIAEMKKQGFPRSVAKKIEQFAETQGITT